MGQNAVFRTQTPRIKTPNLERLIINTLSSSGLKLLPNNCGKIYYKNENSDQLNIELNNHRKKHLSSLQSISEDATVLDNYKTNFQPKSSEDNNKMFIQLQEQINELVEKISELEFLMKSYGSENIEDDIDYSLQSNIPSCTAEFLDTVVNPFDTVPPKSIPDKNNLNTVILTDYYESFGVPLTVGVGNTGIAFFPRIGFSTFAGNNTLNSLYSTCYLTTNFQDIISLSADLYSTNYSTITGDATGFNTAGCLVDALRIFSIGLKVLPQVETITSSDTFVADSYICSQISMAELNAAIQNGTTMANLINMLPDTVEYPAAEGATVRYNPFQLKKQLLTYELAQLNSSNYDWDSIRFPMIYIRFNNPPSSGPINIPFKVYTQYWIEGVLCEPTPIMPNIQQVDIYFDKVAAIMSEQKTYPLSTTGHTFQKFAKKITQLDNELNKIVKKIYNFIW